MGQLELQDAESDHSSCCEAVALEDVSAMQNESKVVLALRDVPVTCREVSVPVVRGTVVYAMQNAPSDERAGESVLAYPEVSVVALNAHTDLQAESELSDFNASTGTSCLPARWLNQVQKTKATYTLRPYLTTT